MNSHEIILIKNLILLIEQMYNAENWRKYRYAVMIMKTVKKIKITRSD